MEIKEYLLKILEESKKRFSPYNVLYDQLVHLPFNRPIYVLALGKAAYQMVEAVHYHASQEPFIRIKECLVITRYGNVKAPLPNTTCLEASHLVYDENSLKAGDAALEFVQKLGTDDILIVLLSGGGVTMMEKPVEGVSLEQFNARIQQLVKDGASTEEIDAERKQLSAIKGGKLLQHIQCKHIYIYAMSEVPGDIPKYIASNPFMPDAEKADEQMSDDKFHKFDNLTADRFIPQEKSITYKIIANNKAFCEILKSAALDIVRELQADYVHIISTEMADESCKIGKDIADTAKLIDSQRDKGYAAFKTPCLLIFGGRPYVIPKGTGKSGRCTELALAAVEGLAEVNYCALLAYATDGLDGVPEASGAIIDTHTKAALLTKGIDIEASLANNDSFMALKSVDAIIPGEYTGINVNDIVMLYVQ
jgi:hydroxypyruvate reductase